MLTLCGSIYSLMSSRIIADSSLNSADESVRASSVLPTPVGPRNMKEPIGREGSLSPALARRMARETALTASSWPIIRSCRRCSRCSSLSVSLWLSSLTGMPVHALTTSAISSAVTVQRLSSRSFSQSAFIDSMLARSSISSSRTAAAVS